MRIFRFFTFAIMLSVFLFPFLVQAKTTMPNGSSYERKTIKTSRGKFKVDVAKIPLTDKISVIADSVLPTTCYLKNCPAQSFKKFIGNNNNIFAGINGAYFCSSANCKANTFLAPFFDTKYGTHQFQSSTIYNSPMINNEGIYGYKGAMFAFDVSNTPYFFPSQNAIKNDFKSLDYFNYNYPHPLKAAFSNSPALIYNSKNIVSSQVLEKQERTRKTTRSGFAVKDETVYLLVVYSATVLDLAAVMETLSVDNGLNLDGGASSGLFFNKKYIVTPGRKLPTAIIFSETK